MTSDHENDNRRRDQHRKERARYLVAEYGKQAEFLRRFPAISKARASQATGLTEAFGEKAAATWEEIIGLPMGWFNNTWPTPSEARKNGWRVDAPYPATRPQSDECGGAATASTAAIQDARDILVTITFTKAGAAHFDQALEFAQASGDCQREQRGQLARYRASFAQTPAGADAALQLLAYLAGGSAVYFVHANGRLLDTAKALEVLNCYVNSFVSRPVADYCRASLKHNPLPCAMLIAPARADDDFFDPDDNAETQRHIKAAAIRAECEWCPHFENKAL
jgi:hypothetical protein